MCPTVAVSLG